MKIEELKPSKHVKGRFLVKLEDGTLLKVTESEILEFSLSVGRELEGETLEALVRSAKKSSVKSTAVSIIGSRALSKKELTDRLVRKGAETEEAEEAAGWLEDIGALDDRAYAAAVARSCASRGYGPARVREELRRRGVNRDLWDEALEELPDPAETLDALIRKKCRGDLSDRREVKRVSDSLLRRGFRWEDVKTALRRYTEMEED